MNTKITPYPCCMHSKFQLRPPKKKEGNDDENSNTEISMKGNAE